MFLFPSFLFFFLSIIELKTTSENTCVSNMVVFSMDVKYCTVRGTENHKVQLNLKMAPLAGCEIILSWSVSVCVRMEMQLVGVWSKGYQLEKCG